MVFQKVSDLFKSNAQDVGNLASKKGFLDAESPESTAGNKTAGGAYRYPLDESFPVYMHYRVREVIPPLQLSLIHI